MVDAAVERAGGEPNGVTKLGGVRSPGDHLAQRSRIWQCVSQLKVAGSRLAVGEQRDSASAGVQQGYFGDQTRWPSDPRVDDDGLWTPATDITHVM